MLNEDYKGFIKDLTKEDLNKEEMKSYNKLMEGINKASSGEKDEVAHLMDVFIETEEKTYVNCVRCGESFSDDYEDLNTENKRIYCDDCLRKMWGSAK